MPYLKGIETKCPFAVLSSERIASLATYRGK